MFDVIILGAGVAGSMMARRLSLRHPGLSVLLIDRDDPKVHPFHLHRPIDLPGLDRLAPAVMRSGVFDGREYKHRPSVYDVNTYALKTFGHLQVTNINNVEDQTIYPIGKDDLVRALHPNTASTAKGSIDKVFLRDHCVLVDEGGPDERLYHYRYLVSTIPLPALISLAEMKVGFPFQKWPFWTAQVDMGQTNLYQMVYNSSLQCNVTRTTLLGDTLFVEANSGVLTDEDKNYLYGLYDLQDPVSLSLLTPGRITPLAQEDRKPLLHYLTENYDVMTLGRFGAWTFKVANDVWDDTEFLCSIIHAKEQANAFKGRSC